MRFTGSVNYMKKNPGSCKNKGLRCVFETKRKRNFIFFCTTWIQVCQECPALPTVGAHQPWSVDVAFVSFSCEWNCPLVDFVTWWEITMAILPGCIFHIILPPLVCKGGRKTWEARGILKMPFVEEVCSYTFMEMVGSGGRSVQILQTQQHRYCRSC